MWHNPSASHPGPAVCNCTAKTKAVISTLLVHPSPQCPDNAPQASHRGLCGNSFARLFFPLPISRNILTSFLNLSALTMDNSTAAPIERLPPSIQARNLTSLFQGSDGLHTYCSAHKYLLCSYVWFLQKEKMFPEKPLGQREAICPIFEANENFLMMTMNSHDKLPFY